MNRTNIDYQPKKDVSNYVGKWLGRGAVAAALFGSAAGIYALWPESDQKYVDRIAAAEMVESTVPDGATLTCYRRGEGLPASVQGVFNARVAADPRNRNVVVSDDRILAGLKIYITDADSSVTANCQK